MAGCCDMCSIGLSDSGHIHVQPDGPVIPPTALARSGLLAHLSLTADESVELPISKEHMSAWLMTVAGSRRCISVPQLLLALQVRASHRILQHSTFLEPPHPIRAAVGFGMSVLAVGANLSSALRTEHWTLRTRRFANAC